jgi:hypothetical protein
MHFTLRIASVNIFVIDLSVVFIGVISKVYTVPFVKLEKVQIVAVTSTF